jgi:ectoine hydroxylase-related dioxygenase (phytanoyl-CoA dioxygenase family)
METISDDSLKQAKSDLKKQGFAIIKNVFSQDEVNLMRGAAMTALMECSPDREYQKGGKIQTAKRNGVTFPALMFWPCLVNNHLNEVRTDNRISQIVTTLVGKKAKQLNNQIYFRLPGDSDSFAWHQDIMFRESIEYDGIEKSYIQTVISIDEITEDNAPLEFIVGSHKFGKLNLIKKDMSDFRTFVRSSLPDGLKGLEIRRITTSPGDMVLWSLLAVHGSPENTSTRSRMTYMNGFFSPRHSKEWPEYLDGKKLVRHADNRLIPYGWVK